jgi:uncharacterized protein YceK
VAKRVPWSLALLALAVSSGGCGTVLNTVLLPPPDSEEKISTAEWDCGKRVYGGVLWDWEEARHADYADILSSDPDEVRKARLQMKLMCLLDLPLSAVGDTLMLPYTVPCAIWRLGHPESPRRPPEAAGPEGRPGGNAREETDR